MTENTTVTETTEAPATTVTKKVTKAKASQASGKAKATKKAPAKKTTEKREGLTSNQVKALTALKGGKSLTRNQLKEKTGIAKGWSKLLGAATKGVAEDSLEGLGYVKSEKFEDQRGLAYTITAAGRKALEKTSA